MDEDYLLKIAKKAGFKSIEDYVRANLKYLPPEKQALFHSITSMGKKLAKIKNG